ncbi:MAG: glycine cleavage T C-terminal barrel domain-containing protein [Gemmatimonadota bacterium]|nr:glycine cleavage T C-terminal barrel domain-containing protein [Gemmatimonadota bacterium]
MSGMPGYAAATERAAWCDASDRVLLDFTGPKVAETLNGLLTNDVAGLAPGTGQYAAALTPKGKVIADLRVFAHGGDRFIVDASAAAGPPLLAMLRKFVNPRLAKYVDLSAGSCTIRVAGPDAGRVVAAATGVSRDALDALAAYAIAVGTIAGTPVRVVRAPDLGVPCFDVFGDAGARDAIVAAVVAAGAEPLDAASADVLRIEAGWPRFGVDFDENVLAQEAGIDRLGGISFDKGCYTGQETVARVHFRGHVNRTLRGLRSGTPLPPGAEIHAPDGKPVGTVRSSAVSPRLGPVALAFVRREVADGDAVSVAGGAGPIPATVATLPFA